MFQGNKRASLIRRKEAETSSQKSGTRTSTPEVEEGRSNFRLSSASVNSTASSRKEIGPKSSIPAPVQQINSTKAISTPIHDEFMRNRVVQELPTPPNSRPGSLGPSTATGTSIRLDSLNGSFSQPVTPTSSISKNNIPACRIISKSIKEASAGAAATFHASIHDSERIRRHALSLSHDIADPTTKHPLQSKYSPEPNKTASSTLSSSPQTAGHPKETNTSRRAMTESDRGTKRYGDNERQMESQTLRSMMNAPRPKSPIPQGVSQESQAHTRCDSLIPPLFPPRTHQNEGHGGRRTKSSLASVVEEENPDPIPAFSSSFKRLYPKPAAPSGLVKLSNGSVFSEDLGDDARLPMETLPENEDNHLSNINEDGLKLNEKPFSDVEITNPVLRPGGCEAGDSQSCKKDENKFAHCLTLSDIQEASKYNGDDEHTMNQENKDPFEPQMDEKEDNEKKVSTISSATAMTQPQIIILAILFLFFVTIFAKNLVEHTTRASHPQMPVNISNFSVTAVDSTGRAAFSVISPATGTLRLYPTYSLNISEAQKMDLCTRNIVPSWVLEHEAVISGLENLRPRGTTVKAAKNHRLG